MAAPAACAQAHAVVDERDVRLQAELLGQAEGFLVAFLCGWVVAGEDEDAVGDGEQLDGLIRATELCG